MVIRRGLAILALLTLGGQAVPAPAGRNEHNRMFKHGLKSFDYEKWREAAVFFTRALKSNPDEGSVPAVQVYGQRWVPYLPHFFFGIALFEIGQFSQAREQWKLSSEQLATLESERKRRNLERYKRRKSGQLGLTERFFSVVYPRSFAKARRDVAVAEDFLGKIELQRQRLRNPAELSHELSSADFGQILADLRDLERSRSVDKERDLSAGSEEYDRALEDLAALERKIDPVRSVIPRLARVHRSLEEDFYDQLFDGFPDFPDQGASSHGHGLSEPPVWRAGPRLATNLAVSEEIRVAEGRLSNYLIARALIRSGDCRGIRRKAEPLLRHAAGLAAGSPEIQREFGTLLADFAPKLELARAYRKLLQLDKVEALRRELELEGDPLHTTIASFPAESTGPSFPRTYALLIGASEYRSPWPDLPGALEDVRVVQEVLQERPGYTVKLIDDPTYENIDKALEEAAGDLERGDRLLFYYAGHGHAAEDWYGNPAGHIVPTDAPPVDDNDFQLKAFSMGDIREWDRKLMKPVHKLFVFDSCYSGMIFDEMQMSVDGQPGGGVTDSGRGAVPVGAPAETRLSAIEKALRTKVAMFVSAGTRHQPVPDQSIFRKVLVKALESPGESFDRNQDGYLLGYEELGPELSARVKEESGLEQYPRYGKSSETADWVFRLPRRCDPAPLPWEDRERNSLEEIDDWNMAVATDGYASYLELYGEAGLFSAMARSNLRHRRALPSATVEGLSAASG